MRPGLRELGPRLCLLAVVVLAMSFHTEVYAQLQAAFGSRGEVPTLLKWSAFVGIAVLLSMRGRR